MKTIQRRRFEKAQAAFAVKAFNHPEKDHTGKYIHPDTVDAFRLMNALYLEWYLEKHGD